MTLEELKRKLYKYYCKDLCYPKIQHNWNENNKYYGMCAITSLIVNDFFGGFIGKIYVNNISHYFNLIDGEIVDLTKEQFFEEINYNDFEIITRDSILTDDTKRRYNLLKKLINRRVK